MGMPAPAMVFSVSRSTLGSSPMLRRWSSVISLAVVLVGLPTAQAADTTLTLACQGTTTDKMKDAKDAKTRADFHGHHRQLHEKYGPRLRHPGCKRLSGQD